MEPKEIIAAKNGALFGRGEVKFVLLSNFGLVF
jgi:hypothetical protein